MRSLYKSAISAVSLLAIILVEELVYEQSLFDQSLKYIPEIQRDASQTARQAWKAYSDWGLFMAVLLPILVPYLFIEQRSRCFYYVCVVTGTDALSSILKLQNHQARPFWVSEEVQAFACSNQYGNPSGHSLCTIGVCLAIWLDLTADFGEQGGQIIYTGRKALFSYLGLAGVVGFGGSIMYSRLFLGVHSINQVIYGCQIGIWFALTIHYILREPLRNLASNLIATKEDRYQYLSLSALAIFATLLAIQAVNYETVKSFENPQLWSDMLSEKCGSKSLQDAFQARSLTDFGMTANIWGAFFGILLQSRLAPGLIKGQPIDDTIWKKLLRLTVGVISCLPWYGLRKLVKAAQLENMYALLLLKDIIPSFMIAMSLFFAADLVSERIGLLKTSPAAKENLSDEETGQELQTDKKANLKEGDENDNLLSTQK